MQTTIEFNLDQELVDKIHELSQGDADYWSFKKSLGRPHSHAYFQYPAMMVPQVQGALIDLILACRPGIKSILDPFVGSGTVLSEAMSHGLDFYGQDINPLAVLVCKAKAGFLYTDALGEKLSEIKSKITCDVSSQVDVKFPGIEKWFRSDVAVELSKIRRAILSEPELWARRFFWVAFAEVIRRSSNSRTSTFKLHIRPEHELSSRSISPVALFLAVSQDNISRLQIHKKLLKERGHIKNGRYMGRTTIKQGDTSIKIRTARKFDLLITSPPYGDNRSTVPYGQFSYLSLQWIDLGDIEPGLDSSCVRSTYEIDTRSLGGRMLNARIRAESLKEISPSFAKTCQALVNEQPDRLNRVASFMADLAESIETINKALEKNSHLLWTVGNRMVGGQVIPTDRIISELLKHHGISLICSLDRSIYFKRMAHKNTISSTMGTERIMLFRKGR